MNDILPNIFSWIRDDYKTYPVRFAVEIVAWADEWTSGRVDEWRSGWADKRMGEQVEEWTGGKGHIVQTVLTVFFDNKGAKIPHI